MISVRKHLSANREPVMIPENSYVCLTAAGTGQTPDSSAACLHDAHELLECHNSETMSMHEYEVMCGSREDVQTTSHPIAGSLYIHGIS